MKSGFNSFSSIPSTSVDPVNHDNPQAKKQTTLPVVNDANKTANLNEKPFLGHGGAKAAQLRGILSSKAAAIDPKRIQAAVDSFAKAMPLSTLKEAATTAILFGGNLAEDAKVLIKSKYFGSNTKEVMEDVHNFPGFTKPGFSDSNVKSESASTTAPIASAAAIDAAKDMFAKERSSSSLKDAVITAALFGGPLKEVAEKLISSGFLGDSKKLLADNRKFANFVRPGII